MNWHVKKGCDLWWISEVFRRQRVFHPSCRRSVLVWRGYTALRRAMGSINVLTNKADGTPRQHLACAKKACGSKSFSTCCTNKSGEERFTVWIQAARAF